MLKLKMRLIRCTNESYEKEDIVTGGRLYAVANSMQRVSSSLDA